MVGFLGGVGAGAALTIVVNAVDKASPILKGINTKMLAIGGAMTAIGVAGVVGLAKLTTSASDLAESVNAVEVVFGDSADAITAMSKTASTQFGLSQRAFNEGAVQFSAFANVIAEDGGDVVDVIGTMTGRTADFASVMNIDLNRAQTLVQAGLAGETEGLRRFGIDVSAASIKTFAYANGIATAGEELTEQEKILARYGSILKQTDKFAGDFVNTSDDLANSQRILKADTENLKAEFAQSLLPVMQSVVGVLRDLVGWFGGLSPLTKQIIIGIVGLTAVLLVLAGVIIVVTAASSALAILWSPITLVVLAVVAAIAALVAVGVALWKNWETMGGWLKWVTFLFFPLITAGVFLMKNWTKIVAGVKKLGATISNVFIGIANIVGKVWNFVVDTIEKSINRVIEMVNKLIRKINKIKGINIGSIGSLDLGKFKAAEFSSLPAPTQTAEAQGNTTNVTIQNVNGLTGRDLADSLQDELENKVSLGV